MRGPRAARYRGGSESREVQGRPGAVHAEPGQGIALALQASTDAIAHGVDGDVRGDVARAVRPDVHFLPVAIRRERAVGRAVVGEVAVVDGDGQAGYRLDGLGPRLVPGFADLGPFAGFGERPPRVEPRRIDRVTEPLVAGLRVDQHQPRRRHRRPAPRRRRARCRATRAPRAARRTRRARRGATRCPAAETVGRGATSTPTSVKPASMTLSRASSSPPPAPRSTTVESPSSRARRAIASAKTSDAVTAVRKCCAGRSVTKNPLGP